MARKIIRNFTSNHVYLLPFEKGVLAKTSKFTQGEFQLKTLIKKTSMVLRSLGNSYCKWRTYTQNEITIIKINEPIKVYHKPKLTTPFAFESTCPIVIFITT